MVERISKKHVNCMIFNAIFWENHHQGISSVRRNESLSNFFYYILNV